MRTGQRIFAGGGSWHMMCKSCHIGVAVGCLAEFVDGNAAPLVLVEGVNCSVIRMWGFLSQVAT